VIDTAIRKPSRTVPDTLGHDKARDFRRDRGAVVRNRPSFLASINAPYFVGTPISTLPGASKPFETIELTQLF
jgi:hypothetical protein